MDSPGENAPAIIAVFFFEIAEPIQKDLGERFELTLITISNNALLHLLQPSNVQSGAKQLSVHYCPDGL